MCQVHYFWYIMDIDNVWLMPLTINRQNPLLVFSLTAWFSVILRINLTMVIISFLLWLKKLFCSYLLWSYFPFLYFLGFKMPASGGGRGWPAGDVASPNFWRIALLPIIFNRIWCQVLILAPSIQNFVQLSRPSRLDFFL